MQQTSAPIEVIVYPGVHHAFDVTELKPSRPSAGRWVEYDEAAARDAEAKTRVFLTDQLTTVAPAPRVKPQ